MCLYHTYFELLYLMNCPLETMNKMLFAQPEIHFFSLKTHYLF